MAGPYPYPDPFPPQPPATAYPDPGLPGYPGPLPPPVTYPRRRRRTVIAAVLGVLAVLVGAGVAAVLATRGDSGPAAPATTGGLTEAAARAAIQEYLDALADGDRETVARHTLCGLADAVRDHSSDLEVAELNSDAFRKQFRRAEVTSIDKIVRWSQYQAQALFTMRTQPSAGTRNRAPADDEIQGVAQLQLADNQVLVCNYVLRTDGEF
ncbi:hypothetical protein [uncultured Mycolicibacterium sp.]|uniref:Rv0361 family membrane protein n=1 Tax=uncultured Mycolicibacterium sp. TaxID=2320817 RepID=UPI002613BB70|nr:hypothetical protein [uncultured Mycolicibacterium sp.]